MQPQAFMQRLAALVPRPRLHLIRFHGVLAPNATLRAAVIAQPEQSDSAPAREHAHGQAARMRWAAQARVPYPFGALRVCVQLKILAAIE
jgi:hypothetical protein